jgi:hypothetical protein
MPAPACPCDRLCNVTQECTAYAPIANATQLRFELMAVDDREFHGNLGDENAGS